MNFLIFSQLQAEMLEDKQQASELLFNKFNEITSKANICKVCINLDWLSVSFRDENDQIPEPQDEDQILQVSPTITLKNYGKGNQYYKHCWHVLYNGEHLATIMCHTRNQKFVPLRVLKVDFKNHLLYTSSLWPLYDELVSLFNLQYKNVSRVDIAIDGLNYLMEFINLYVKQVKGKKAVEMKGRSRLNCKVFDRKLTDYQNFNVGTGDKYVTMYNKSLDIVKTGKDYIQLMWLKNGITKEMLPLEVLAKTLNDEKIYLDGYENIYRFEVRLKGEMIKKIQGFNINWLKDPNMLMSIVKRMNESFFEFVWYTRSDTSKCKEIDVMPYNLYTLKNIDLIQAKPKDDLYKTKLSIKKNVRQLFLKNLSPDDYAVTEMLLFDVGNFELEKWYADRIDEWVKDFSAIQPDKAYAELVQHFVKGIIKQFNVPDKPTQEPEILEEAPF